MRKLVTATLMDGARVAVFDNVLGSFNSATLAKVLTSDRHSDRILGASATSAVRTLFMLTGNNLTLAGDMPLRVLVARIDPRMETRFARSFDLDPERHVIANRQMLVAAALMLLRLYCRRASRVPATAAWHGSR
ncbi:MAG: hypothetical protein IT518_28960 [Burkholderiales bacterium]|nr:hypothetical protein [Burkholderiales bacterium]